LAVGVRLWLLAGQLVADPLIHSGIVLTLIGAFVERLE